MSEKMQKKWIDEATVQKIAHLSRVEIPEEQRAQYAQHLTKALKYFEQIQNVSTDGVEPLVTPVEMEFVFREDEVVQELSPAEIISNAPSALGHLFKVPPVV